MATKNFYSKKLILEFNDLNGTVENPVIKRKTINNINELSTPDEVYLVATSLRDLQTLELIHVFVDEDYLMDETQVVI